MRLVQSLGKLVSLFAPCLSGQYHSAMQSLVLRTILLLLLAVPLSAHNSAVAIDVHAS